MEANDHEVFIKTANAKADACLNSLREFIEFVQSPDTANPEKSQVLLAEIESIRALVRVLLKDL